MRQKIHAIGMKEIEGGLNTYAYVSNNPISFTDPAGLLIRGSGLSDSGWARVKAAEQKIRDEMAKTRPGSSCSSSDSGSGSDGDCIPSFVRQMILNALDTTTVNAARTLQLDGADLCGVTTLGGSSLTLAEDAFKNPLCHCLTNYRQVVHFLQAVVEIAEVIPVAQALLAQRHQIAANRLKKNVITNANTFLV